MSGRLDWPCIAVLLAGVAACLASSPPPGHAAVFCKKKNATVVARETCRAKETSIALGQPAAQVTDSAGVVVGTPTLDIGGPSIYAVRVVDDGTPVLVEVATDSIVGIFSLEYESTDCTGAAYIFSGPISSIVRRAFVSAAPNPGQIGQTLFYGKGAFETRTFRSQRTQDGTCEVRTSPEALELQPAATATLPPFSPPFTIR